MKNERIKKYEKLTIVSDKVQKMLVNALLNNGKAEDLKEAEAMSVSELYSLAVPNLSTIAFKTLPMILGHREQEIHSVNMRNLGKWEHLI